MPLMKTVYGVLHDSWYLLFIIIALNLILSLFM